VHAMAEVEFTSLMPHPTKLGRKYVNISQLENGHKSPTVDVLFRIGPILGVAASELLAQVERALQSRRS
jgi:transcriptional regulator with XRE-family HTH domain